MAGDYRRVFFLAAEASAGFRLNDSNLVGWQPKQLQQRFVDVIRALHGAPNRYAVRGIGDGDRAVGFDIELLLSASGILAFDDMSRGGPRLLNIAFLDQERFENVVLAPYK